MSRPISTVPCFRYRVESSELAQGGRAWSIFEERPDGSEVVLASGAVLGEAGQAWQHDELVTFIRKAEALRQAMH